MTFWVLVAVMVAVSCSVKEDRGDCPCYLELDCSELDRAFVDVEGVAERFSFGDLIRAEEYGSLHEYQVPRGELRLIINGIIGKMIVWDSRFLPWEGQQMDSLFARSVLLDTRCDGVREVLRLNKQFATVTLAFAGGEDGCEVVFRGNVCGVDPLKLEPYPGPFRFTSRADPAGEFSVRVPRQLDDSLVAEVYRDGHYVETVPVGVLIERAGFDWTSEDLGDVRIEADLPAGAFSVTVMDWLGPERMSVMI